MQPVVDVLASSWHVDEHPSPAVALPSSHVSPMSSARLPHVVDTHAEPMSVKPGAQVPVHMPITHAGVPLVIAGHIRQLAPQYIALLSGRHPSTTPGHA